jgi:hypothetical protein
MCVPLGDVTAKPFAASHAGNLDEIAAPAVEGRAQEGL